VPANLRPMKKLQLIIMMIPALWLLQACKGNNKNNAANTTDSITKADSMTAVKDSSIKVNVMPDSVDIQFAAQAAIGGIAEVELGKLAMHNGGNKRVKNFGEMMVKDRTKSNDKLTMLAKAKNITLPVTPGADDQKTINELLKKTGKDFDEAYINDMIENHKKDIRLFEFAASNCSDPDIKKFAVKTLRVLKNHLDAINIIQGDIK
jgi:putative membrane protein